MKAALLIVLSLSAVAFAGPAFNKNNQINQQQQQQQQNYMTGDVKSSPAVETLKQWCFSSQMSQQELTASFKKLVACVKSAPVDLATESAVMSERICQGALVQKTQSGSTVTPTEADAKAHELIKDVYMDALISCKSRECTQQLLKVIGSQQVDTIRAAYYMTRIAVSDKQSLKGEQEIKQFVESFVEQQQQQQNQADKSEAVERQKLFATTALIAKWAQQPQAQEQELKQVAEQVVKTIVERYIKPVSEQEVEQYKQQQQQTEQPELAKKIAKRSAALKALANIPGHVLKRIPSAQQLEQLIVKIAKDERELSTVRQSAIECLEQNDKQKELLKELTFDQEQPIEVRIAAYRALMTVAYEQDEQQEKNKEQMVEEIIEQLVKHCEQKQQSDEQFVLYVVSHLDNIRTSQQPEVRAVKQTIAKNKQHYMQVQVLAKKLAQKLADVRSSSRNYKLEQEFDQINSGLVLEGDLIYESKHKQQQIHILPKLIRVNMSMPIMGESVNVVEVTVRQNQMDESILAALKLAQSAKFNSESVAKVVDSFKSSVEKQQTYATSKTQAPVEADLTIKVDGCTVVYMSVDDIKAFKTIQTIQQQQQHQRNTRSVNSQSLVEELVELLKRAPINFNRGFNVNINERLAKLLDVDANILAGLRFESRAQGDAKRGDFELAVQMEPRFSFEAIVGPSSQKLSSKKLLQRVSTKTALGLRLRFKKDELVDINIDLPMNNMELFTVETQLVEKNTRSTPYSYNYLPESIYGDEDIYAPIDYSQTKMIAKRSIFGQQKKQHGFFAVGKQFAHTYETSEQVARATGLRGKLRVVVAPKDLSLLVSAQIQKVEPQMQGFRVKVEKSQRQGDQWTVSVSTPNSRVERTTELRIVKQLTGARSIVKCELPQSPFAAGPVAASIELIHDGRQYAVKAELVSQGRRQWRHQLDAGLVVGSQSAAGRLAQFAYKPYVSVESSALKRPISLQGQLAFVQSPKSVISYELKCSTTGDFVQGKLIVDQRDVKMSRGRRSMRSPIELLLEKDLTITNELLGQIQSRALKVHNMAEWSCQQFALKADSQIVYKNLRKSSEEARIVASMKLDQEQQVFQVERKSPGDARNDFTARLVSIVRQNGHQMELETRQHKQQSVKAYKHKVDIVKVAPKKYEAKVELELVDSERALNEKLAGRARISTERQLKAVEAELQSRAKQAKLSVEFVSLAKHQIVMSVETERFSHKCELRNNERQLFVQSRTQEKRAQQMLAKLMLDCQKQQQEAKLVFELGRHQLALAADLKLQSGKRSSLALQTGRFASQLEFSFDTYARQFAKNNGNKFMSRFTIPSTMRLRSNLKDLEAKQTYWMDSELSADQDSFIRVDSPIYRTDFEFSPRELEFKLGAFARSKRSVDHFDAPLYSTKESSLFGFNTNANTNTNTNINSIVSQLTPNKMWMLRSIVASPYAREALKQKARRALFEYADRRAATRHSMNWAPEEQRLSMDFARQPTAERAFEPVQAKAELSTSWARPSTMSLSSQWMDVSAEMNPALDSADDSYAKIVALSRHPRSAFKKHESEFRYNKREGYKAHMKHQDAKSQEHQFQLEADAEPRHWAKMAYESDKHGKTNWEHQWRKQQAKRASTDDDDEQQVYANKFELKSEGPAHKKWQHETRFDWQEPIYKRQRRSYNADKFAPIEYLKHTNGRLVSSTRGAQSEQPMYKLDFDYQPQMQQARLNVDLPEANMMHSSEFQYKPSESLYKLTSKYLNRLTQEPSYEFALASKPFGLATGEQEPMFFAHEHEMYERPISKQSFGYQLFKQPLKLDYSDKFGRIATIDYDTIPTGAKQNFAGLRQKRAAVYYKDQANDFQHSTSYDFYPESYMAKMKPTYYKQQQQPEVAFKTETKFGPVVVRADSNESARMVAIESPLMNVQLSAETFESAMRQLVKLQLDNKSQRVQLAKIVRDSCPEFVRDCKLVKKFVRKFDSGRFEHQSELLVSFVESIFKIKSASKFNERPVVVIEGEWNSQQDKAQLKINGERVEGHAIVDLVRKNAELVLDVDHKQTVHHVTRMVRTSDKFYSIESTTSCKSRPLFKLVGKVSAMLFDLEHVFSRRQQYNTHNDDHLSTFEAVVYEPKEMHVSGQFDCDKKEARVVFKNVDEQRIQETFVRFEQPTESIVVDSRLSGQREGQIYAAKAKLSLPGLYQSAECRREQQHFAGQYKNKMMMSSSSGRRFNQQNMTARGPQSCQSEMIYADNQSGSTYAMKYMPGEYVTIESPRAQQFISLAKYYHQY